MAMRKGRCRRMGLRRWKLRLRGRCRVWLNEKVEFPLFRKQDRRMSSP